MSHEQLSVPHHDLYFTTGETVGTPAARFPDCGLNWIHIRPSVSLECWPYVRQPATDAFTTISSWWAGEWMTDGNETYDNNKRFHFLRYLELPSRTTHILELALNLGCGDEEERQMLERHGWRVQHSHEVAGSPEAYQGYIQR